MDGDRKKSEGIVSCFFKQLFFICLNFGWRKLEEVCLKMLFRAAHHHSITG